jgi:hypothetical protein
MSQEDAIIEFIGGPYDGHVADTRDHDHISATLAQFICLATDHGEQTGKVVQGYSPAGMDAIANENYRGEANDRGFRFDHKYRVVGRSRVDGRLRIKMEYVAG